MVVIDLQNGFCHPDGSAARSGMRMWQPERVTHEHVALLREGRRLGVPVVLTRYVRRRNGVDTDPAIARALGSDALLAGSWDAELVDELEVTEADTIIDKRRFDSFLYTDLDLVLRTLGTRRLLLTGVATNGCVETTARTASQLGYDVLVAEDATSAKEESHHAGLESIGRAFGRVLPWRDALAELT